MKILDELDRREKKIYLIAGISLVVIAATGILLWRINQKEKLSSEESEAAESVVCGGECVNDSDCKGWNDGSGNVECNQGSSHKCEIYKCSSGYIIGPSKCACIPSGGIKCGNYGCATDEDCAGGSDTDPDAEYECNNRADGNVAKQQCIRMKCPTGYKVDDDNCTCVLIVENKCDGGGWTNKPSSFTTEESFTMSGYAQDTDGIDLTSITVKINNTSLSSSKITKKEDSDTKASWSTTLSGYTAGSYTATVSWKDKKGTGGSSCTLTATFAVTEPEEEEYCISYWTVSTNSCKENKQCSAVENVSVNIDGITTFSTLSECQEFVAKDYWQVEDNQCVAVSNIESALGKFHTSGLKLFESLSACQATLNTEEETTTTTPQTGLLDEAWGKIALGFTVLAMGMISLRHNIFEFNWVGVRVRKEEKIYKSSFKNSFEKKVAKRN